MLLGQEVRAVNGKGHLEAVTVEDLHSGGRRRLAAGALVVLIGATPTPIGWQQDRLDPNGFGRDPFLLETSRPGVSAVGDVRAGGAGANGSGHLLRRRTVGTPNVHTASPRRDENSEPMAPAAEGELVRGSVEDEMRADLTTLLDAVSSGEVTHADFYDRLEEIHDRHLGDSAKTAEHALMRRKALTAFEDLGREAPSRHHELELLAEALGIPYS